MSGDLDKFLDEVREESEAAGLESLAEFDAYLRHYELSRQILLRRRSLGWSQPQLARKSGVQQSEISRIERGQGNPTYETLTALAGAMGARVSLVSTDAAESTRAKGTGSNRSIASASPVGRVRSGRATTSARVGRVPKKGTKPASANAIERPSR